MADRIKYAFGIEVKKETTPGTYVDPDKALCVQADSELYSVEYKSKECSIMSQYYGSSHTVTLNPNNPHGTIPVKQPLPMVLGGIEDMLIAASLKKGTADTPARIEFTMDSATQTAVSVEVTTFRTVGKFRNGVVDFSISGEVNDYIIFDSTISALRHSFSELTETDPDNTIPSLQLNGVDDVLFYSCDNPILIDGTPASCKSFTFELGADLADIENDVDCRSNFIVNLKPKLTIKADSKTDLRFKTTDMVNATEFNIKIPFASNTGAEKGYILMPKCTLAGDPKITNNNGLEEVEAVYDVRNTAGDDNFTIAIYT